MDRIIFACDIDNTLIYSRKHPHDGWPCVEWIHEKEQAYMSPRTCELLREVEKRVFFVPVTSRSAEQYMRIQWPVNMMPQAAITTHGAKLFKDCDEDPQWQQETRSIVAPWQDELQRMAVLLTPDPSFIRCRMVDESYLFVYCAAGIDASSVGDRLQGMTSLNVCVGGKKIYLHPPELNKGTAMQRLRVRYPQCRIVAAGDSAMDLDMLNAADFALYPAEIASRVSAAGCCCPDDVLFSEYVMQSVLA